VLIASLDHTVFAPVQTHNEQGELPKWITMQEALPLAANETWLHTQRAQKADGTRQAIHVSNPAPTLDTQGGKMKWSDRDGRDPSHHGTRKFSIAEALILQDFDPTLRLEGTQTSQYMQIGNAIPVRMASACLKATGHFGDSNG